ncbi:MAG: hypothetical protein EP330_03075 [Deltaproteobacteria bacterium]|nr:MAG: hypothetical protein EP330_03075 [Deltaproteobacteria bacterium]
MLLFLVLGCNDPGSLTINNTDPSANIDAPGDGEVVSAGLPLWLEGTVGDAETPEVDLIVQWRVNGEVVCDDPADAFGETRCEVQLLGGDNDVTLQVADGAGGIAEDAITLSASRCFDDEDTLDDLSYSQALGSLDDADLAIDGRLQDNFQFTAVAGDELAFHGWSEDFDARLEIYDPGCERIVTAEDGGRGSNAFTSLRIPEDGTYTVVIGSADTGSGDYVLELIDDSIEVGSACALGSTTLDLWASTTASTTGELTTNDQEWPPSVGNNFYFDDIETWLLYGDTVTFTEQSSAFAPALSLFRRNHASGGCARVGYDGNDDGDDTATVTYDVTQSTIYAPIVWARYSNATGPWTLTASVSF